MSPSAAAKQHFILTFLLTLMSLLGVFPLDVILPSFPALAHNFSVTTNDIAHSMSIFALGVAVSQCLIGPLSDRIGRQKLMLMGILISVAGAIGCSQASSYQTFMIFRSLQAFGCGCFVLCQALIQDIYSEQQRNSIRIFLATTSGVFISLSPLAGILIQKSWNWQGTFFAYAGLGLLTALIIQLLPREGPVMLSNLGSAQHYKVLLTDLSFFLYSLLAGLSFTCHFAFVVVSPLLFIDLLDFSEYEFSLVFIVYGLAYLFGGYFATLVNRKCLPPVQIAIGMSLIATAGLFMFLTHLLNKVSVITILLPMIICTAGTTISRPAATSCALERHPGCAGTAAALCSTLLFAIGGLISGLIASAEHNLLEQLSAGFIIIGAGGCLMMRWLGARAREREA